MDDFIRREAAIETLSEFYHHKSEIQHIALREALNRVPTADVVEVVRCKDCKWCHSGYCERFDDLIPFGLNTIEWENWFCADGIRRADNG